MVTWRKYNGALIPEQPPHIDIDVDQNDVLKNVIKEKAFFARWTTDFDCNKETEFWYVICDEFLPIESLSKNTRNNVRRGLKRCYIKKVKCHYVIENCYLIYKKAFDNYNGHLSPISEDEFKQEYSTYVDEKVWDFWVVYENQTNKVIAYSRNKIEYNQCELCTTKFHPEFLRKFYPSEALFYTMNKYYLDDKNFDYVNDGARSISHETNIQSFLIQKFKFRKAYCKLNIIYNKPVGFLVKVVYPFRLFLKSLNWGPFTKLNILINQEKIRRSYD